MKSKLPDNQQMLLLDNQLCFQFYRISKGLTKAYQPVLKPLGLTYLQYLVLLVLWEHNDKNIETTIGLLCERLCLDTGTISPLLKRMEKNGWIVRKPNASDQRQIVINLSNKGLELNASAASIPQTLLKQFSQEELVTLISIQEKMQRLEGIN